MIINSLSSKNLLKYGQLEITDLPPRGLIAVCGPNESGKSSIGETLSFALFGRTFALGPQDRRRLIKWGASRASAVVEFTAADGHGYRLERYVDDEGTHGARLDRIDGDPENLAQGADRVDSRVPELIGFDFESFVESFYLAQREITSPHAHSHAVKIIAGLAPYEAAATDIGETVREARQELEHTQIREAELQQEIVELGVSENHLEQ